MTRKRQENVKSSVKNVKSLHSRPQCCHCKRFREAMVVFDLEQSHMVRYLYSGQDTGNNGFSSCSSERSIAWQHDRNAYMYMCMEARLSL